ncbi:MAG: Crp/Fnr family transcriptional regulator [Rhodospirillaceae bacterium]
MSLPTPTADAQAFAALSALPLFRRLPEPVRRGMAAASTVRTVAPGSVIASPGAAATEMFVILEGYVKLTVPAGTIDVVGAGTVVGESAVTGLGTYPTGAIALDSVRLVAIDGAAARGLLGDDVSLVLRMMGGLSASLRGLLAQVTDLKLKTTTQRLAMYLLELGGREDGEVAVTLPFTKRILAEKLGMTPESLSRSLTALEALGVRQEGRGQLVISDAKALAESCGYVPFDAEHGP